MEDEVIYHLQPTEQVSFYIALDLGRYHSSVSIKEHPTLLELLQDTKP